MVSGNMDFRPLSYGIFQNILIWIYRQLVSQLEKNLQIPLIRFSIKTLFSDSIKLADGSIISTYIIKESLENHLF